MHHNCHTLRALIVGKKSRLRAHKRTVIRRGQEMIKCELCGQYFPINQIECHHSVIEFSEIRYEYSHGKLSLKDARDLARSKDNIMAVCAKCHKKLHPVHKHKNFKSI